MISKTKYMADINKVTIIKHISKLKEKLHVSVH